MRRAGYPRRGGIILVFSCCMALAQAQTLSVEIDNLNFFRNNEYAGSVIKGYTLPGLWFQPKAIYIPSSHIRLEAGLHTLLYHGSYSYPALAYQGIPQQKAVHYQPGAHLLPWFRAQATVGKSLTFVWGNIYGAGLHRLPEPLYNPELSLTADPETGVQILLHTRPVEADLWTNWQNFIFHGDRHQEVFTFGLSARINGNPPDSRLHFYLPIAYVGQHRGGEIDTIQTNSVQTLLNASGGIGLQWNTGRGLLRSIKAEALFTAHVQQSGELWPIKQGYGYYALVTADIHSFRLTASHFQNRDFISLYGLPFFSAVSSKIENTTYHHPTLTTLGVEYIRHFGKDYSLAIDCIFYCRDSDIRSLVSRGYAISNSACLTFRIHPSFLLKRWNAAKD